MECCAALCSAIAVRCCCCFVGDGKKDLTEYDHVGDLILRVSRGTQSTQNNADAEASALRRRQLGGGGAMESVFEVCVITPHKIDMVSHDSHAIHNLTGPKHPSQRTWLS